MIKVTLLDTSVATDNLGDEIIMDSIEGAISSVIPDSYIYRVQTHDTIGRVSKSILKSSEFVFVGGTNILSSRMFSRGALWKIGILDIVFMKPVILLATGWRGYMRSIQPLTRIFLNRCLDSQAIHSVRDSYTLEKLEAVNKNILNTGCVTMWGLTEDFCRKLPLKKSKSAVTTLTYYNRDVEADRKMLVTLRNEYESVSFWPQQAEDLAYMKSLGVDGIAIIPPRTSEYDAFLSNENVDFVGTRLHGGIRAMQKGRRALIIGIDNRATEISRDTGLHVVGRADLDSIKSWINEPAPTNLKMNWEAIAAWKAQF